MMLRKRKEPEKPRAETTEADEDFLTRWSRRKRVARRGGDAGGDEPSSAAVGPGEGNDSAGGAAEAEASGPQDAPARVLTDADMPPLESLDENSDYSGFLSSGVSEELRRKALRKLFLSPLFNVVDGLDDYDDDFTSFEALGDLVTADMRLQAEREAEKAKQKAEEALQAESEAGVGETRADAEQGEEPEQLEPSPTGEDVGTDDTRTVEKKEREA